MAEADTVPAVLAAGGIVVREESGEIATIIIHRPRHDDWSFPKGKLDPGESSEDAALREVFEETALLCRLEDPLGTVDYPQGDRTVKQTRYWIMRPVSDRGFVPNDEVDAVRWVALSDAAELVTHPLDRALARRARSVLDAAAGAGAE